MKRRNNWIAEQTGRVDPNYLVEKAKASPFPKRMKLNSGEDFEAKLRLAIAYLNGEVSHSQACIASGIKSGSYIATIPALLVQGIRRGMVEVKIV